LRARIALKRIAQHPDTYVRDITRQVLHVPAELLYAASELINLV
jgi:hypothetical protein